MSAGYEQLLLNGPATASMGGAGRARHQFRYPGRASQLRRAVGLFKALSGSSWF